MRVVALFLEGGRGGSILSSTANKDPPSPLPFSSAWLASCKLKRARSLSDSGRRGECEGLVSEDPLGLLEAQHLVLQPSAGRLCHLQHVRSAGRRFVSIEASADPEIQGLSACPKKAGRPRRKTSLRLGQEIYPTLSRLEEFEAKQKSMEEKQINERRS